MARRHGEIMEERAQQDTEPQEAGLGGGEGSPTLGEIIAPMLKRLDENIDPLLGRLEHYDTRMEELLGSAEESTRSAGELTAFLKNQQCAMQDAIHAGVGEAIGQIAADAQRRIEETERAANAAIRAMEREARERVERVERINRMWTLKNTLKTAILLVGLVFMAWYAVATIFFN